MVVNKNVGAILRGNKINAPFTRRYMNKYGALMLRYVKKKKSSVLARYYYYRATDVYSSARARAADNYSSSPSVSTFDLACSLRIRLIKNSTSATRIDNPFAVIAVTRTIRETYRDHPGVTMPRRNRRDRV